MPAQISPLTRGALDDATRRLSGTFRGVFSDQTVARVVEDSYERLGDRPTVGPNFMPIFVDRFCHELSSSQVAVHSAGSHPTEKINPVVVQAMSEIGIDVRMEFPKPLTDEVVRAADVVVTLGCGDACPVYPGKRYQDWQVADPAGQPLDAVRRIRYDIHHHVTDLLDMMNIAVVEPT